MTQLDKPVHRVTRGAYSTLYTRAKKIVVSLTPGDFITFREFGSRTRFTVPIDGMFKHAIRLKIASDEAQKRKEKKHGKQRI